MIEFEPHDYFNADDQGYISRKVFIEHVRKTYDQIRELADYIEQYEGTIDTEFEKIVTHVNEHVKQLTDLYNDLLDNNILDSEIQEKLTELEQNYAPRLSTLEQNDVSLTAQLQQNDTKLMVTNERIDGIDRGYGGTFNTISELQTTLPTGDTKRYVVSSDGNWYYWNGENWISGGVFQSTGMAKASITPDKLSFTPVVGTRSENMFNKYTVKKGVFINSSDGAEVESNSWNASEFEVVEPDTDYHWNLGYMGAFYDVHKNPVSSFPNGSYNIHSAPNAAFVRVSALDESLDIAQLTKGVYEKDYIEPYLLETKNIQNFKSEVKNATPFSNSIYLWKDVSIVNDNTINLGIKPVFNHYEAGKRIYFNVDGISPDYTINDGQLLVLNWDGMTDENVEDFSILELVSSSSALGKNKHVIASFVGYQLSSPIPQVQQAIYKYKNPPSQNVGREIGPMTINDKLSDLAPSFYEKYLSQSEDVTVVLNGDSISTTNYYTAPRDDAKNRPPLMLEHAYVTDIEEQLRWDGQKYHRYDTDIFTETAANKDTLEYDLQNWDWASNNNRPALTRVLSGSNVSVSYVVPSDVKRCDFIYRTDSLNADSAAVAVSGGNGILSVLDEEQNEWVEANGYTYSAKESANPITTPFGPLIKSMYQKRLKMKVVGTLNNTTVTITNNGSGRLTYWGIQTGMRDVMFDFILSARGGHSIGRLEQFEDWDTDYYKPDLILWQIPIINQNLDVGNADFTGKNVGIRTTTVYANTILAKANQYKAKPYTPELVSWVMFFGKGNNAIDTNNDWVYGYTDSGERVSVPSYLSKTIGTLEANGISVIDMFSLFMDYSKKKAEQENKNIIDAVLSASGRTGSTLTIDGTHLNDLGSDISTQIFGPFFIQ